MKSADKIISLLFFLIITFSVNAQVFSLDSTTVTDVTGCYGDSSGIITIHASGGTQFGEAGPNPYYEYSIDAGSTWQPDSIFTGLTSGFYSVYARDSFLVTDSDFPVIGQPTQISISIEEYTEEVDCFEDSTGEIHFNALDGTPPYIYIIENIDNGTTYTNTIGGDFTGLGAGTYDLIVQDVNGCIEYFYPHVTITQPDELILELDTSFNVNCYGNNTGYIRVKAATGGQPPYRYSKDGGITYNEGANDFYNLIADDYQTSVTDGNGCEVFGPLVTITQPDTLSIDSVDVTNVEQCYGDDDGIIKIFASGGVTNYLYSIDNGNSFRNDSVFTNLEQDNYYIRIEDANKCEAYLDLDGDMYIIDTVVITEPPRLIIPAVDETHISCNGENDGEIQITATGGTPNITQGYQYSIDGSPYEYNGGYFDNLSAGTHTVITMDDSLCTAHDSAYIYEPEVLIFDTVYVTHEVCPDENNGSVIINYPDGGTPPFLYRVLEGDPPYQLNNTISDLEPGGYTPEIIDANGCTATYPAVTIEPAVHEGLFSTNITEGCSPLEVQFTRINPETDFTWDFGDGTESTNNEPTHIFYNTTIDTAFYTVAAYSVSPDDCRDTTYTVITVYPQPQISFTLDPIILFFPEQDSTVTITNTSPVNNNPEFKWNFGDGPDTLTINDYSFTHKYNDCGEYLIFVSAVNSWSCYSEDAINYTVTAHQPEAMFAVDTTQSCEPVTINFENQSLSYITFEWDLDDGTVTDENSFAHTYDTPGTYNVTVNTIGYCDTYDSYTIPITVFQSPIVDFDVLPDTVMLPGQPIHCYNSSSEDSDLFFWEFGDGGTSEEEDPIHQYTEPGSYYVMLTVTSLNKCVDSLTMLTEVIVLPEGEVIFPNAFTPNGDGDNDEFKPAYFHSVKTFKMEIYNRWGERMFLTDDIDVGWNGYINGVLSLQDVYVWRAEGLYLNGTPFELSGSLTLMR